jgi:putative ABC transport system ATP-binding protein
MHIMAGLDSASSGRVWLGDTEITRLEDTELTMIRRRRVGFVFQSFNLVPTLDIEGNILLPFELDGRKPSTTERQWIDQLIDSLGLRDRLRHRPHELSGGQQQRVAIARAIAMEPTIILFDEPTSSLDPELVREVLDAIRILATTGMTSVIVTHEMSFAHQVANRVIYMDEGAILEQGTPEEVFGAPREPRTRRFLEHFTIPRAKAAP